MSEFYDIHTHILPGIDDGCRTAEESAAVLREEIRQGCAGVIATPHYYSKESITDFVVKRERSFEELKKVLGKDLEGWEKRIKLGAEVAYTPSIAKDQDLGLLRLGGSDYILIELPFREWDSRVIQDIRLINSYHGLTPVIAHIERYRKYVSKKMLRQLIEEQVVTQINAGMFSGFFDRITAGKWIRENRIQLIATDTHNIEKRPPNIEVAEKYLIRSGMEDEWDRIMDFSERIWGDHNAAE